MDVTGLQMASNGLQGRNAITRVQGILANSSDLDNSFADMKGLQTACIIAKVSPSGSRVFGGCINLVTAVLITNESYSGLNMFNGCSNLVTADLLMYRLRTNCFTGTKLDTLILRRSDAICAMEVSSVLNIGVFKSGGAGGDIYIPEVLYDHLGDGSALDYKAATNWSTIDGYGTITWHKIEGSQYENYYADGTPISS